MARRLVKDQEKARVWSEMVQYMHQQVHRLKDAYHGNVLAVYKTRDPEENESIAYDDKPRDRLTDAQERRLRQQCLAVRVFYSLLIKNGVDHNVELCAQAAANSPGVDLDHGSTVVKWEKEYRCNDDHFLQSLVGKHDRNLVIERQDVKHRCLKWVRKNARRKGRPNMTVNDFQNFLNNELLPEYRQDYNLDLPYSIETARKYLHRIGVKYSDSAKGLYFDHHQRPDVLKYRDESYLPTFFKHLR